MPWPTKKLGELVDFLDNQRKPINDEDRQKRVGPYPYYGANGQVGWIDDFIFDEDLVLLAEDGGYFGLKDRPIAYRISGKSWVNNHAHVLRVRRGIAETGFIHYRLMFYDIKPYITGSTRTKLNKSAAEKIKILLPPLATQKQIVERLDKIAEAQKLNDDLIQKSDELFQSLLHQELNPVGKDWEIKKLGDTIKPQYGYTISAKDSGNYRFIRITDIGDDGELRDSDKKYVTLSQNEAENYQLRNGDLLLARTGATFGKILYFKETELSIFASFLIRLNPSASIDPFYIWLFSRSQNYWRQARTLMTGSGQPQFNANKLKQIKIPVPPLKQQKQIVEKLSAVQEYKTQLLEQKKKLKELFDSALHKSFKNE